MIKCFLVAFMGFLFVSFLMDSLRYFKAVKIEDKEMANFYVESVIHDLIAFVICFLLVMIIWLWGE